MQAKIWGLVWTSCGGAPPGSQIFAWIIHRACHVLSSASNLAQDCDVAAAGGAAAAMAARRLRPCKGCDQPDSYICGDMCLNRNCENISAGLHYSFL